MPKIIPAILVVIIFFYSCGTEKPINTYSQQITKTNADDLMFRYYDSKTKTRYDIRNDDSLMYIILETNSKATQMRIIKNGIRFYVSPLPIKNESRFVQYPAPNSDENKDENKQKGEHNRGGSGYQSRIMANISKVGLWNDGTSSQTFLAGIDKVGFVFQLNYDKDGYFHYEIGIAKNKLIINKADTTTCVGIYIPTLDMPSYGSSMAGGRQMGTGQRGGGMNGMSNAQHQPIARYNNGDMEGADEKVNWWFQIKIK
ncbi:MAG: hypothetical protein RJA07_1989 [Bacteroidota bacterium]|jgi:hypothetical protein